MTFYCPECHKPLFDKLCGYCGYQMTKDQAKKELKAKIVELEDKIKTLPTGRRYLRRQREEERHRELVTGGALPKGFEKPKKPSTIPKEFLNPNPFRPPKGTLPKGFTDPKLSMLLSKGMLPKGFVDPDMAKYLEKDYGFGKRKKKKPSLIARTLVKIGLAKVKTK